MRWISLFLLLGALASVGSMTLARAPAPRPKTAHTDEADRMLKLLFRPEKAAELLRFPIKIALPPPGATAADTTTRFVYAAKSVTFDDDGWVTLHACRVGGYREWTDENGQTKPQYMWSTAPGTVRLRPVRPVKTLVEVRRSKYRCHKHANDTYGEP